MDCTGWRGKCFQADLPRALALMSELLYQPRYERKHFITLKRASADNLRRDKDFPATYAFNRWLSMIFGKQNNVSSTSGRLTDLERISLDDLTHWHQYLCNPNRLSLVIVGNHKPEEIFSRTEALFASRISPASSPVALPYFQSSSLHQITHRHHSDQAVVQIGAFAPQANDEELNAALISSASYRRRDRIPVF
jgi:predicted Zn-dependent peptidase